MKTDILILFGLVLTLALIVDLSKQQLLPSWMNGIVILVVIIAYLIGKARGRKEKS